mgnify:CR=1 FL=1
MIKVNIGKDHIQIKGHAMFDDYGKNIVCAGVSSVVTTTINAILSFDKDYINYINDVDKFVIVVNEHN